MSSPYKNIRQHVITVLVEDKPGVLARISSMFARRGFNIHSLAVGPTVDPQLSRMTVVADGPEMEQIIKQLYKLVNTVKVTEHRAGQAVEREIMLVRINADAKRRGEILDAAGIFNAQAVDVGASTITFEVSGDPGHLADFLELMRPYGIVDLVKSGRIALARDPKSKNGRQAELRSA
jgi:acetolactate synthase-1/3 small subunit